MRDLKNVPFHVGCRVARAVMWGKSPRIDICTVTRIQDGKLYLDESKVAMRYPERLLIVEQEPLEKMINSYAQDQGML